MTSIRSSGILLHPTSLPGPSPIGDLGKEAFQFVDFLADAKQSLWQVLPLGPTGAGHSPYNARSSSAGNPLLISLERLAEQGWLHSTHIVTSPYPASDRVDFEAASERKMPLLRAVFDRFQLAPPPEMMARYESFVRDQSSWLDDYALFESIHHAHHDLPWNQWDEGLAKYQPHALSAWREEHPDDIGFQQFVQFLFSIQWSEVKGYANERGIQIIGDIPIYVSLDSSDVWSNQHLFLLDDEGQPIAVAGVPPDLFSATGQLWGNPLYRWDLMAEQGYQWWIERFNRTLELCDIVRVDHFRGFDAGWQIPAGDATAENGRWVQGPGLELFRHVLHERNELPIIVEDLGVITREVEILREQLGYPGMKIMQFAFGGDSQNPYLPHNIEPNSVVYTGTHDNDTTRGWYKSADGDVRTHVMRYLGREQPNICWDFIRLAMGTVAHRCVMPLQDVLELDNDARMNLPGTAEGNWRWRMTPTMLRREHACRLAELTALYGRDPRTARPRWS